MNKMTLENDQELQPFAHVVAALKALPDSPVPAGFADRVVAAATGADPLAAHSPFAPAVAALRSLPPARVPDGFADRVVANVRRVERTARRRWLHVAQAAATLALLATAAHLYLASPRNGGNAPGPGTTLASGSAASGLGALLAEPTQPRPQTPLQILLAAQRPDGAFAVGGDATGVTALAILALLYDGNVTGASRDAIAAGLDHLVAVQRPDGSFAGGGENADYANYLATKALGAARRLPEAKPEWATAAKRALPQMPEPAQVAVLNRQLAHPEAAGLAWQPGSAVPAALAILHR